MSLKCRFLMLFLLTFTVSLSLHALLKSDTGTISGNVRDSTGAVLPGAQIKLQPGATSVTSNANGDYVISDIAPGSYTVTVMYLGFTTFSSPVTVVAGQTASLNAVLTVSSNSQQVTVHGELSGDAMALNEQKTSANILNVMTAPTIMSLPNANVADALGRLPGVTLQRNEGEGQYVQIRGTEPRLSNTTIDGVIVPGPDPEVRQVDLDTIPADLVGSVAINKTLSANQDGDAIGGSVDLRIKQATSDRPTLSVLGMVGHTPIDNGRNTFLIAASAGDRFGPYTSGVGGKRLGLMLGYSYDLNDRGIDDVEPVPDLDANGNKTFDNLYIQQYLYNRTRYGFAGSLDYKLAENSDFMSMACSRISGIMGKSMPTNSPNLYRPFRRLPTILMARRNNRVAPNTKQAFVDRICRSRTLPWAATTSLATPTSDIKLPVRTRVSAEQLAIQAQNLRLTRDRLCL